MAGPHANTHSSQSVLLKNKSLLLSFDANFVLYYSKGLMREDGNLLHEITTSERLRDAIG